VPVFITLHGRGHANREDSVPPTQCPECGRFLANAFVTGLADAPAPCPRCGAELTAGSVGTDTEVAGAERASAGAGDDSSAPVQVDDGDEVDADDAGADVLAGWDSDGAPTAWLDDRAPFPEDAAWVGGAAAAGAVLGLILDRRAVRGLLLGSVLGAGLTAVARQIWRLRD
jgi:hypothetical protein